ncbi:MAG: hypothetical protein KGO96_12800 [Elusimicrobia bacterium]|nr:hypothetical protein [Elusimicrobiota bacterium]
MPAKGSHKNCCCGGCGKVWTSGGGLAQFCAGCRPYQICAEYACLTRLVGQTAVRAYALLTICQPDTDQDAWVGVLILENNLINLSVAPGVDSNNQCYLSLTAPELGVYDVRQPIDTGSLIWNTNCQNCATPYDEPVLTFSFSDTFCRAAATISIRSAANTSLTKLPLAYGCTDPCTDPYAIPDPAPPCLGECADCLCLCSYAQLTFTEVGVVTSVRGGLCGKTYAFETGHKVVIDCCSLKLYAPDGSEISSGVAIGRASGNLCPTPTATWWGSDSGNVIMYSFYCIGCDDKPVNVAEGCHCHMPPVLACEVIFTPDCLCAEFGPLDVVFDLVYDPVLQAWTGEWQQCAHGSANSIGTIKVTVSCSDDGPGSCVCDLGLPAIGQQVMSPYDPSNCSPVHGTFEASGALTWSLGSGGPCGLSTGAMGPTVTEPWSLTVKVME